MKVRFVVLVLSCSLLTLLLMVAPAQAQTRNVYGYILNDPGQLASDVTDIVVTDVTQGSSYGKKYHADGWYWSIYQNIGWYKNGLPANHAYFVDVYTVFSWSHPSCGFYLSTGFGSYKVRDMSF